MSQAAEPSSGTPPTRRSLREAARAQQLREEAAAIALTAPRTRRRVLRESGPGAAGPGTPATDSPDIPAASAQAPARGPRLTEPADIEPAQTPLPETSLPRLSAPVAATPSQVPMTRRALRLAAHAGQIGEPDRSVGSAAMGGSAPEPIATEALALLPEAASLPQALRTPPAPAVHAAGPGEESSASGATPAAAQDSRADVAPSGMSRRDRRRAERGGRADGSTRPAARSVPSRPVTRQGASADKPTRRWVPRLALLATLGLITTGIPLTSVGAATSEAEVAPLAPVLSATSALDVLEADPVLGTDTELGSTLVADPLAQVRAATTPSRELPRQTLECGAPDLEGNGSVMADATVEPVQVMMPLRAGTYTITSTYGPRWGGMHEGLDMAAPIGTPIHAVASGTVVDVTYGLAGRSGMIIIIEHQISGQYFQTWYVHSYPDGVFVEPGQQVTAGDVIGEVGNYGNSTGAHLHLEVHLDRSFTTVNPGPWLTEQGAAPVTAENIACAG